MKAPYWGNYNLYKVLNIKNFASDEEIKCAYRKLALRHHPDKNGGKEAMIKLINLAKDVFVNHRAEYDYWLKRKLGLVQLPSIRIVINSYQYANTSTTTTNGWTVF